LFGIFIEMLRGATKTLRMPGVLKPAVILVICHFHREADGSDGNPQNARCFETGCNSGYLVFS